MNMQVQVQFSDDGQWWWDGATWRSVSGDPPPAQPVANSAVPPELVAVLRPHVFLAAHTGSGPKYVAPVDGVVVDRDEVAVLALVLPLLTLWEEGAVTYEHTTSKKLMMTFNSVKATVTAGGDRPGVAGELLKQLRRHADVDNAVRKWLGNDHNNPWNHVIGTVINEGVDLGVYRKFDAHRNFVAAAFKGSYTIELDADRARATEPEGVRLAALLKRHREGNPELHDQLWKKVHGAIKANTARTDTSDI